MNKQEERAKAATMEARLKAATIEFTTIKYEGYEDYYLLELWEDRKDDEFAGGDGVRVSPGELCDQITALGYEDIDYGSIYVMYLEPHRRIVSWIKFREGKI